MHNTLKHMHGYYQLFAVLVVKLLLAFGFCLIPLITARFLC